MKCKIIVEQKEYEIILNLIKHIQESENQLNSVISKLKIDLETAQVIDELNFPKNVIRLNSIVDVETPFGMMKAQIVLPKDSNSNQKRISLFTTMGAALFGYSQGDQVVWVFPNGEKNIKICKVSN